MKLSKSYIKQIIMEELGKLEEAPTITLTNDNDQRLFSLLKSQLTTYVSQRIANPLKALTDDARTKNITIPANVLTKLKQEIGQE